MIDFLWRLTSILQHLLEPATTLRKLGSGALSLHLRTKAALLTAGLLIAGFIFGANRLSAYIDARLADGALGDSTILYSAPVTIAKGDAIAPASVIADLHGAGYTGEKTNPVGTYAVEGDSVTIKPGRESYFRSEPVRISFANGKVVQLTALNNNAAVDDYALEPEPLVRFDDNGLQKRRPVQFKDIPKILVDAVLSAEDKHFFYHAGFDPLRIVKAAFVNARSGRKEQGGSTLTMQLARNLYLDAGKTWERKLKELSIAEMLEWKLSKQQIFEYYANQVYLGRRDVAGLHGFGQAAESYFGKELPQLTLAEAATLAGLIQRPSYFDPVRHADRAMARRNVILGLMHQNGFITAAERDQAMNAPLGITSRVKDASGTQWFIELAMDDLQSHDEIPQRGRVYTTLDPDLQRAAQEAIRSGMKAVDARVARRKGHGLPEAALIAIDSHTGEVKALVGGRDFGMSQVNHITAMRQPGSIFKPFVYAAALESNRHTFTPATTVVDEPTTFQFEGQEYSPSNFGQVFMGTVTLRRALSKSLNVATVSVAEQTGYARVLEVARSAGFNDGLKPTPALALGAYEVTPLEAAGAYTVFANGGAYVHPVFVAEARSGGQIVYQARPESHDVLKPTTAFLMQDLLAEVLRTGTAAGIRAHGFDAPAAGKTGTSRDGWFAGYVSNLICIVWVGYDDNADLDLEGARSALPIWEAFMKEASRRPRYHGDLNPVPPGIVTLSVDSDTGLLAGPQCQNVRREYFLRGKEPKTVCQHLAPVPTEAVPTIQTVSTTNP